MFQKSKKMKGFLYLIPTTLGDNNPYDVLPEPIANIIRSLRYFIVEDLRTSRRFLKKIDREINIDDLTFFELNKHTDHAQLATFLVPALEGNSIGVISEAGCPGVADPGADVVQIAHQKEIAVKPLVGPSSILLSLMASGMNGQNFAFVGYLPIKQPERVKKIKDLERLSRTEKQTQIFIETPYRNNKLIEDVLQNCETGTRFCIACDLTLETEYIATKTIGEWKKKVPDISSRPSIFLIQCDR